MFVASATLLGCRTERAWEEAQATRLFIYVTAPLVACAREVTRLLRPGGRAAIFDKWLPEGARPSPARRALNVVASAAFSDLNRQLGPILGLAGLQLVHREPAGLGGAYQAALAVAPERSEGGSAAL